MTYKEHIKNLKEKKELLPLHKMDDVSRRQFIQSVGTFMAALTIPSMIRLETMSKLSRKIFGSSMAYAANAFSGGNVVIEIKLRSGFNLRWPFGIYGDDSQLAVNANVPWDTGVTANAAGSNSVILSPAGASLAPYAKGIQYVQGKSMGGHMATFSSSWIAGLGETTALAAATEIQSGSKTLLPTPFAMGDPNSVAVQNIPTSLQDHTPLAFNSINDVVNTFKPINMVTNQNTTLTDQVKEDLLGVIGNQFTGDIMAGVKEKDRDVVTAANDQSLSILQKGYNQQLDPNNSANAAKMTALTANNLNGLGQGNLSVSGMNPAQAVFVLIQAATLGITPMNSVIIGSTGDWHSFTGLPSTNSTNDPRFTTGRYIATLLSNICSAASSGLWKNRDTGATQHVTIVLASEFTRTLTLGGNNDDDGDGGTDAVVTVNSNISQKDFKAGTFGGCNSSGAALGYNASNNSHSTTNAMYTSQELLGHRLNILKIDKENLGLKAFPGISGLVT